MKCTTIFGWHLRHFLGHSGKQDFPGCLWKLLLRLPVDYCKGDKNGKCYGNAVIAKRWMHLLYFSIPLIWFSDLAPSSFVKLAYFHSYYWPCNSPQRKKCRAPKTTGAALLFARIACLEILCVFNFYSSFHHTICLSFITLRDWTLFNAKNVWILLQT